MTPQKLSKPPKWNFEHKEEGGCELDIEFFMEDGTKHNAGYCFLSERECIEWIVHELIIRAKTEKCRTDGKNLNEEVALYEHLLNSVVETFKEKGVVLF